MIKESVPGRWLCGNLLVLICLASAVCPGTLSCAPLQTSADWNLEEGRYKTGGTWQSWAGKPVWEKGELFLSLASLARLLELPAEGVRQENGRITLHKGNATVIFSVGEKEFELNGAVMASGYGERHSFVGRDGVYVHGKTFARVFGYDLLQDKEKFFLINDLSEGTGELRCGGDDRSLLQRRGVPRERLQSEDPMTETVAWRYRYPGMDVHLVWDKEHNRFLVDEFILTSREYVTARGIQVGDTRADMIKAYGKSYVISGDEEALAYCYPLPTPYWRARGITFVMGEDARICRIEVYDKAIP